MLVHQFLEKSANEFPEKPAVWFQGKWINYRKLDEKANKLSNYLIEMGLKRGDRVAILFENSFHYIIAYYAILKCGAITVALNTDLMPDDLIYFLNDSGAKVLIVQKKYLKILEKVLEGIKYLKVIVTDTEALVISGTKKIEVSNFESVYQDFPSEKPSIKLIDLDIASIIYTSGSTGKPKGVVLSHLNIVTNTRSIVSYLDLSCRDRIMVILPFFYVYGKSLLNTHFCVGGSVVIDNRFAFPNAVLKTMKETSCTGFAGVPSTFSILLNKSALHKLRFPDLRYITQAGGPMAPTVQKEVALAFYPAKLYVMYGATEASARLSYLNPIDLPRKWGSIGKAIPNVELYVADEKGNPLPAGKTGEIVARGANIMLGYWKDESETKKVLKYGLYFTGDLGKMDDEGFLYVVGRKKDMIKVGANRISAKEIEEKILSFPQVHEVAVIGVPDEITGEAIKAYIVMRNGLAADIEILKFCKKVSPSYKVPKYIEFVNSLPKNSAGKIMKQTLKKESVGLKKD